MSKKIALLSLYAFLLMPLFLSCQNTADTNTSTPTLDSELELKMRKDYQQYLIAIDGSPENWKLEDIGVQWYYGNYSGCEVVYMWCATLPYTLMIRNVEIAGYTIVFGTGQEAYAYRNSEFYTIKEAYDAKLISKNDVYNIGMKLNSDFAERNPKPKFGCG